MTEPSQYFKGRTVQEQMNEVIGYVDTRAAEVATTAIAADVAQVHQDMLNADADANAAAASAAAAAGTLANAVKKTGEASQSIAGDIAVAGTLSGGVVTGTTVTVPTPVNNTDAASKKYVDDQDTTLKTYVDSQDALAVPILNVNAYAVGLTGNQTNIGGTKEYVGTLTVNLPKSSDAITRKTSNSTIGNGINDYIEGFHIRDSNGVVLASLNVLKASDDHCRFYVNVRNADGSYKRYYLAEGEQ